MAKKRYCLYLSRPLAHQLERVASLRHGSKSALLEEALRKSLEPEQVPGVEEGLMRRLNELNRAVATIARDQTVATETLALFVRYMLTVTPPIPDGDQEPARLTGRKRYDVFLAEVGRRVAANGLHAAEVLKTVPVDQPDLVVTVPRALIAEAIDLIVFINGRGASRRVESLIEVQGLDAGGDYLLKPLAPPVLHVV